MCSTRNRRLQSVSARTWVRDCGGSSDSRYPTKPPLKRLRCRRYPRWPRYPLQVFTTSYLDLAAIPTTGSVLYLSGIFQYLFKFSRIFYWGWRSLSHIVRCSMNVRLCAGIKTLISIVLTKNLLWSRVSRLLYYKHVLNRDYDSTLFKDLTKPHKFWNVVMCLAYNVSSLFVLQRARAARRGASGRRRRHFVNLRRRRPLL